MTTPQRDAILFAAAILLVMAAAALLGCGDVVARVGAPSLKPAPAPRHAEATPAPVDRQDSDLERQAEDANREADEWRDKARALQRQAEAERLRERERRAEVFGFFAVLLAGVGVAGCIWLPVARRFALGFSAMNATVAVLCFGLASTMGALPYVLSGVFAVGALAALVVLVRRIAPIVHLANEAAPHLGAVKPQLSDKAQAALDRLTRKAA